MRAVVQALRSARRPVRSLRGRTQHHGHGATPRFNLSRRDRLAQLQILSSSMYFSKISVALISSLVASGAYFAFTGDSASESAGDILTSASALSSQSQRLASPVTSHLQSRSSIPEKFLDDPAPSQTTRKALVVDAGQLYTGPIVGNEPLAKTTDDYGRKVLEMVTPEQATERLRRNQQSFNIDRGNGVVRFDRVQLASNDPIEDDHAWKLVTNATAPVTADTASINDWMFWGVFDGHSGWTTSATLREKLITYVSKELVSTYKNVSGISPPVFPTAESIDAAIKRGFVALDTSIVQDSVTEVLKSQSKAQAASLLAPALSGSCALLSFYDSSTKVLRVACTGDSRAVLGRRSSSNTSKWVAHALSTDQTGGTASEAERLRAEHPGEPDVVKNGRILGGLEPSRAFGDASYKWSIDVQEKIRKNFFGRRGSPLIQTPPYVTAEPIVTTTKVEPERGDFVVMATDGLWEMLTNDEVVGLVGQWLEKNPQVLTSAVPPPSPSDSRADGWLRSWFSWNNAKGLPIQQAADGQDESGQRAPIRQRQWGLPSSTSPENSTPNSDRFVVEDKNVATHLIRNALGGANRDMVCALLTLPSPYSRRFRDDLTVEVIFFGEQNKDGSAAATADQITVNEEATTKFEDNFKSKL